MPIFARALAILLCCVVLPDAAYAAGYGAACNRQSAKAATIKAIQADYRAWSGRCVTLRGIRVGMRLFEDRMATLESTAGFGEMVRRSIVLYNAGRHRLDRRVRMVEVTGTIGSCADQNAEIGAMQAANPTEIIMLAGYCHTSLATYVQPAQTRIVSYAPIARLVEAEVPAERRQLVEAPVGFASRVGHLAAARAMVAAMATGDELAFRRLSRPEVQHELDRIDDKAVPDWLRREVREAHVQFNGKDGLRRSFAALYPLADRPERVLVDRADLAAANGSRDELSAFVVCWCKSADCAERWPVTTFDADNLPERPYLCAQTNDYVLGPRDGTAIQVNVSASEDGFAEPAWPQLRRPAGSAPSR